MGELWYNMICVNCRSEVWGKHHPNGYDCDNCGNFNRFFEELWEAYGAI